MKISPRISSPSLPALRPDKTAPVKGPAAPRLDGFDIPRRNDGLGGGNVTMPSLGGGKSTQPSSTLTTKAPVGTKPGAVGDGSTQGPAVTPDSFTREARMRGLLETRIPTGDAQEPGRKTPFQGDDVAPTEADGKNSTSTRGNASEGFPDLDALVSIAKGETAAAPPPAKEPESRPLTLGRIWAEIGHALAPPDKMPGMTGGTNGALGTRSTPNPENDTGEVHPGNPQFDRRGPSIGELTVAQHRQVSQPGDDQRSPDRVHASLEVATKEVMRQHQDGRIDEGPDSQPQVTGSGPATPGQGSGIEQVDGSKPGDPHHPGEE